MPREIYIDRVNYSEDTTLYANFWRAFYDDQFDVNTKKITCYVKLERATQDMLRKFYFFDNAIWILNKIDSYDVTKNGTTRCEFIKVQDMDNYIRGVKDYSSRFEITGTLDPASEASTLTLDTTYTWEIYSHTFTSVTPTSGGPGIINLEVAYAPNETLYSRMYQIEFKTSESSLHRIFTFSLRPNPESFVSLSGSITGYPSGSRLYIERGDGSSSSILLSKDTYSFYARKNQSVRLYVKNGDETLFDQEMGTLVKDTVFNINI